MYTVCKGINHKIKGIFDVRENIMTVENARILYYFFVECEMGSKMYVYVFILKITIQVIHIFSKRKKKKLVDLDSNQNCRFRKAD